MPKKDNSTLAQKVEIRRHVMSDMQQRGIAPTICETHGGTGQLWRRVYPHVDDGLVFERDGAKLRTLAKQRPTWRVYGADCVQGLTDGLGSDMPITLLDADPWGECWPVLSAFFGGQRAWAETMAVVVNDNLRQKLQMGAWAVKSMGAMVEKHGNRLEAMYLEVCREMLEGMATGAGYTLTDFRGYYCGHAQQTTHFMAWLERRA